MNLAYVRISTIEQNKERQVEALKKYDIDEWYKDKASAKTKDRPELNRLLDKARSGDTIYIKDFSRLARSTRHLLEILEQLEDNGIGLVSLNEDLDTSTATGKLLVTMLGAINEFERTNMLERQKEGIALAVEQGKFKGRQPKKLNKTSWDNLYTDMKKGYITKTEMADKLNISRSTLYRRLEQAKNKKKGGLI